MKETVAVLLIACIGLALVELLKKKFNAWIVVGLIAFIVLFQLKYYYAALISGFVFPGVAVLRLGKGFSLIKKTVVYFLLLIIGYGSIVYFHQNLMPQHFVEALVRNHDATVRLSAPHELIHFSGLENDWESVVSYLPRAIWSGLFRPLPTDAFHMLSHTVAFENTLLLLGTMIVLFRKVRQWKRPEFGALFLTLYVVFSAAVLALASPNFGSLVRYKIVFLPVLLVLVLSSLQKVSTKNI